MPTSQKSHLHHTLILTTALLLATGCGLSTEPTLGDRDAAEMTRRASRLAGPVSM